MPACRGRITELALEAMSPSSPSTTTNEAPPPRPMVTPDRWSRIGIWTATGLLLLINIPLFACLPLTSDAALYDLQARCALNGGVLYRDIVEPNLPGVVWIHMAVRSLGGWSTAILRLFDLIVLTGIVILLARWVRRENDGAWSLRTGALGFAVFMLYFSITEWCHCQRDVWMLLPCLGALFLREQQIRRHLDQAPTPALFQGAVLEGVLWATAFWIKPHIAVPALAVLVTSACFSGFNRKLGADWLGVLLGGAILGAIGSAWMISTGAWEHFWTMQLEWNPEYLEAGRKKMSLGRLYGFWQGFAPWGWAHLLAVPTFIKTIDYLSRPISQTPSVHRRTFLLGALYIGWMIQIFVLQHPFAYVHIPGLILAIAMIATWQCRPEIQPAARWGLIAFCVITAMTSPATAHSRWAYWWPCIAQGPTLENRAALQLETTPNWNELRPVVEYLRQRDLQDGELTAYSGGAIYLYRELSLVPSTRYVYLDVLARVFKKRTAEIHEAVANCDHKFVVSSLLHAGLNPEIIARGEFDPDTMLPVCFPEERMQEFPYTQPVVFRSGQYLVHKVDGPIGSLCTEYVPLANVRMQCPEESAEPRVAQFEP